jgi:hypothetical protein
MANYRTALGKTVDMSALAAKNEKTRAVGNMKVNARGDTIDANGKIITPVTAKVNQAYANTVGNRSAQPVRRSPNQQTPKVPVKKQVEELTEFEREIEDNLAEELEIEAIKSKETGKY